MSVVVRMEMPEGCDRCDFCFGHCLLDEKDAKTGHVHFNEVVIADYKGKYAVRKDRPDWCPIICALPEGHGRLVDADALIAEFHRLKLGEHHLIERVFADGVYAVIDTFPAIVPATEGGNHERLD